MKNMFSINFSGSRDNTLKGGSVCCYLTESYNKNIRVEWSFRPFDIFNFNLSFDGGERDYTFSFWCIWVFYIKFSRIFKYFPKEWNSQTNNKKGGFLNSAKRRIGISQYHWEIGIDIWHNGEDSWYREHGQKDWQNKKDFKIYHKGIFLNDLIIGSYKYNTLEQDEHLKLDLKLPEKTYNIEVQYRYWDLKYDRFLFRFLNKKGKSYFIPDENGIEYPKNKNIPRYWGQLKESQTHNDFIKELREHIIILRGGEDWIPKEYRLKFERRNKLNKLNKIQ